MSGFVPGLNGLQQTDILLAFKLTVFYIHNFDSSGWTKVYCSFTVQKVYVDFWTLNPLHQMRMEVIWSEQIFVFQGAR